MLVTSIIAQNFIQISCQWFLSMLLKGLRVSLSIVQTILVSNPDRPGVTRSIINELNSWDIQGDYVEGGSFDGQYFHLSVPAHLTEALHYSDQFICTQDALHKGGVVYNHIREDSSFSGLVEIQTICSEIFSTFNWGKNYKNFFKSEIRMSR